MLSAIIDCASSKWVNKGGLEGPSQLSLPSHYSTKTWIVFLIILLLIDLIIALLNFGRDHYYVWKMWSLMWQVNGMHDNVTTMLKLLMCHLIHSNWQLLCPSYMINILMTPFQMLIFFNTPIKYLLRFACHNEVFGL